MHWVTLTRRTICTFTATETHRPVTKGGTFREKLLGNPENAGQVKNPDESSVGEQNSRPKVRATVRSAPAHSVELVLIQRAVLR